MSVAPLAAAVFLCEQVIEDKDGIVSIIRLLDVVEVRASESVPPEKRVIQFKVLAMTKYRIDAPITGRAELRFLRPSGEISNAGIEPIPFDLTPQADGAVGFNILTTINFVAKEPGVHRASLLVDGVEVAHTVFTLRLPSAESEN
jgi:hypothetical protein